MTDLEYDISLPRNDAHCWSFCNWNDWKDCTVRLYEKNHRRDKVGVWAEGPFKHPSPQGVTKRCRLFWLTNSALVYDPKCGGGGRGCGASANKYSYVRTWSPNKLWRSNYIFNLCSTPITSLVLYWFDLIRCWMGMDDTGLQDSYWSYFFQILVCRSVLSLFFAFCCLFLIIVFKDVWNLWFFINKETKQMQNKMSILWSRWLPDRRKAWGRADRCSSPPVHPHLSPQLSPQYLVVLPNNNILLSIYIKVKILRCFKLMVSGY